MTEEKKGNGSSQISMQLCPACQGRGMVENLRGDIRIPNDAYCFICTCGQYLILPPFTEAISCSQCGKSYKWAVLADSELKFVNLEEKKKPPQPDADDVEQFCHACQLLREGTTQILNGTTQILTDGIERMARYGKYNWIHPRINDEQREKLYDELIAQMRTLRSELRDFIVEVNNVTMENFVEAHQGVETKG